MITFKEFLCEFNAVPASGSSADRPTPVANAKVSPPLPSELCKDRTYCERKKKKKKSRRREGLRGQSSHGI